MREEQKPQKVASINLSYEEHKLLADRFRASVGCLVQLHGKIPRKPRNPLRRLREPHTERRGSN